MINLVQVWPQRKIKSITISRQPYVDAEGNEFAGTHREARDHYRKLHPTKSVQMNVLPKKRKKG